MRIVILITLDDLTVNLFPSIYIDSFVVNDNMNNTL